ncbi:class F sortase [Patescibacteria group bacterium]|nr:class F sortase [Patescibacteria group bacterium]
MLWQKRLHLLGAGLTICVFLSGFSTFSLPSAPTTNGTSRVVDITDHAHASPASESAWVSELPVRLIIPAIEVDALVRPVGLAPDGSGVMDVPTNVSDVGWYSPGVRPGMRGSAVMAGHVSGKHVSEGVFYDLHRLVAGDEVIVMSAGRIEDIFVVVSVETFNYDEPTTEVFLNTDGKVRLNLITCDGEWLSDKRVFDKRTVVFTEQMTDVE